MIGVGLLTFASQFVDQFTFPKEHYVFLVLGCFFLKLRVSGAGCPAVSVRNFEC